MQNVDIFIKNIKLVAILTTGRTGSDYLNACLHGLNEIVTINSPIYFFRKFLDKKRCNYSALKTISTEKILDDFCNYYKKKLFIHDIEENKKLDLNINEFKKIFKNNFSRENISIKEFFLLVNYSYHLLTFQNINENSLLIYHSHSFGETEHFLRLFPESSLLITIRDPRDNLKSSLINTSKFKSSPILNDFFFRKITRIHNDALFFKNYFKQKKHFIKLETANSIYNKRKLCRFLNIKFDKKIMIATYGKNSFYSGDIYSDKSQPSGEYSLKRNQWLNYFFCYEKIMLNYLFNHFSRFGYRFYKINLFNKILFSVLSFLPFAFEFMSFRYIKNFKINFICYAKRVKYFLIQLKNPQNK